MMNKLFKNKNDDVLVALFALDDKCEDNSGF